MAWAAVAIAGASLIGGALSASAQSSASNSAAQSQEQASQQQAQTQAAATNAQWAAEAPTRALGGYATSELAYLMGLSPNLNTSMDFMTPQVNSNGTVSYVPSSQIGGTSSGTGYGPGAGARLPIGANGRGTYGINNGTLNLPSFNGNNAPITGPTNLPTAGHALNGMQYGSLATNPLSNPAMLTINPDYRFVLGTNESLINNQLAASGHGAASTGGLETAMNYGTGLASTTYAQAFQQSMEAEQNTYNELAALAGEGQTATNNGIVGTESGAAGISGAQGAAGSAAASGAIGGANAFTSGIGTALGGLNNAAMYYELNQAPTTSYQPMNISAPNLNSQINAPVTYSQGLAG
jgi:hypothetical protein